MNELAGGSALVALALILGSIFLILWLLHGFYCVSKPLLMGDKQNPELAIPGAMILSVLGTMVWLVAVTIACLAVSPSGYGPLIVLVIAIIITSDLFKGEHTPPHKRKKV